MIMMMTIFGAHPAVHHHLLRTLFKSKPERQTNRAGSSRRSGGAAAVGWQRMKDNECVKLCTQYTVTYSK